MDTAPEQTDVEFAHEEYLNHLMRCRGCYAPTQRFCCVGLALRIEYDALYLLSIEDSRQRRALLVRETHVNPWLAEALKTRVVELYNLAQGEAQEVGNIAA
ncbi:hypothetical protein [Pseudomonas lurida]|uniref:hypothetical protein n=1 Tax=Pseudomonas lurida TaxID=244566 RepID=UPI00177E647F|nr:hypothetical protein [Pseudomonas lurida]MBD8671592.1 hypothetical protein [Pseudomonas lurida]